MNYLLDYHLHSTYSPDGEMTMDEACNRAIEAGLKEIAITDHMDIDLPDNKAAFQIEDLDQYFNDLISTKNRFQDKLKVKAGIEFGLQDWTLQEASRIINVFLILSLLPYIWLMEKTLLQILFQQPGQNKELYGLL